MNNKVRPKIIAGMPALNEEKYVGSVVLLARQHADEVIVVDDGSTDRTASIAELAGAGVVRHGVNKGYGMAIRSILAEAKKRDADILVILDADSQHNPGEIPALVQAVSKGADVVIGSRKAQGNVIPLYRRLGQGVLSRFTYAASRQKVSDTESGFRAYSRKAIATLELKEQGMAISSEIVSEAAARGLKVAEVPISVTYTADGSTLNPVAHGFGVLNRIIVMISERRPLFFFGMFGAAFLVAGVVALVWVVNVYSNTQVLATGTMLGSILFVMVGMLSVFTGVILNVILNRIGNRT